MPRKSSVLRLPPELRERIGALLGQGRTLDEIKAALDGLGGDVSRSALGRYKQRIERVGEKIRRSREVAEVLVQRYGDAPEGKTARLNIELMHGVLNDLLSQIPDPGEAEAGDAVVLDPEGAMQLSKALDHLARAKKADAELETKIREQLRKESEAKLDKAVAAAAGEAKRESLTPAEILDRVKAIYRGEA